VSRRPSRPGRSRARGAPGPGAAVRASLAPRALWLLVALFVATMAAYKPAWHGGPIWDDDRHVTRAELTSVDGLRRIWFEVGAVPQYYPLAHSAFWVMHRVWGEDTTGYHLVNIALHATSAWLVAMILLRLGVPGACLAAVVFALHPVHVESVAWITELKNTLSALLYLAAAWVYLRFDEERRGGLYALAVALFVLALLSKSVTATLPAALLVVFWWRRGRLGWRQDVRPLVPFFVLGLSSGALTAWVERTFVGAVGEHYALTWIERGLVAGRAFWFYLGKLLWPVDLVFTYPRWQVRPDAWWQYLFPAGVLALLVAAWWGRGRSRGPLAAMLFFCGTLFPALGFVDVYPFKYSFVADHFQYLASLGVIALVTAAILTALGRWMPARRRVELAASVVLALPLAALTWAQCGQYADAETLYRMTLRRNPSSWMAHNNLGVLKLHGSPAELEEAIAHFQESLRLFPDHAEAHNNLGLAYQRLGRFEDARREHAEAVRLQPDGVEARYNLGIDEQALGHLEEAVKQYRDVVRVSPGMAAAHNNLGMSLGQQGRFQEAAQAFRAALRLDPGSAVAHMNLARALVSLGRPEEAVAEFREAVRLDRSLTAARLQAAETLQTLGMYDEAIAEYTEALRYDPRSPDAHNNLGIVLARRGRLDAAASHFAEALRIDPSFVEARENLARAQRR
jgi:tetratricopeptide (TPR) repeat protein